MFSNAMYIRTNADMMSIVCMHLRIAVISFHEENYISIGLNGRKII